MSTPATQTIDSERMRELLRRVRQIEIRSRRAVQDVMGGEYHSVFKGRGMEFDQVREYSPGDEIRDIDWNVTARTGRPFIKRYVEEREQTVFFLVDASASGVFGTTGRMKGEIAAEICAVLAFSAIKNNDQVGMLSFTDAVEELIPPQKGRKHVLRVVRQMLFGQAQGRGTDIALAVDTLNRLLKRRAIVFLVSDFLAPELRQPLLRANRRHDLVAIHLLDPREAELPPVGIIELHDAETGRTMLVDAASRRVRERYANSNRLRLLGLEKTFQQTGVDHITIRTDQPYLEPIVRFFRMRAKRY